MGASKWIDELQSVLLEQEAQNKAIVALERTFRIQRSKEINESLQRLLQASNSDGTLSIGIVEFDDDDRIEVVQRIRTCLRTKTHRTTSLSLLSRRRTLSQISPIKRSETKRWIIKRGKSRKMLGGLKGRKKVTRAHTSVQIHRPAVESPSKKVFPEVRFITKT